MVVARAPNFMLPSSSKVPLMFADVQMLTFFFIALYYEVERFFVLQAELASYNWCKRGYYLIKCNVIFLIAKHFKNCIILFQWHKFFWCVHSFCLFYYLDDFDSRPQLLIFSFDMIWIMQKIFKCKNWLGGF